MEEHIQHISPIQKTEGPPEHVVQIVIDGEKVGEATLEYFSKPFPLYYVSNLGIYSPHQSKGYGRKVMEFIEHMLKEKGKAGILFDAIDEDHPVHGGASGMYQRRGWEHVTGLRYAYNIPKGSDLEQLKQFQARALSPSHQRRRQRDMAAHPRQEV